MMHKYLERSCQHSYCYTVPFLFCSKWLTLPHLNLHFFSSVKFDSVIYLNQRPIFYCYVVKCDFKNRYQKDMWAKEFGLCAQNVIIILGSIVNIIGGDLY